MLYRLAASSDAEALIRLNAAFNEVDDVSPEDVRLSLSHIYLCLSSCSRNSRILLNLLGVLDTEVTDNAVVILVVLLTRTSSEGCACLLRFPQ